MREMTGADAIVDALVANGIETIFGLPGGQLDHLFDAIYRAKPGPRLIHTRHEQGAAYMAFGYAQSTGRVGAYTVVPGPGLLNSTAALCTARACGAPVLAISGQVHLKGIDSGYGHLHEIPDQLGLIRHLTKWAGRIETAASASGAPSSDDRSSRERLNASAIPVSSSSDAFSAIERPELATPTTSIPASAR